MHPHAGALVAVGGAEDKTGDRLVLRRALEHVPGAARRVAIVPTASREPRETAAPYLAAFRELGASEVAVVDIRSREDAALEAHVEAIRGADLVFMTGGDQARLAALLSGTPAHAALRESFASGVLAGSSAGAAAMSGTMIAQGATAMRKGDVVFADGLGFLPHVVVDTHFTERGRFGRLVEAVATHPGLLGIGLGEDTAIVVKGSGVEVVGAGNVVVVDGREMRASNASYAEATRPITAERLIVHTYSDGSCFRLEERHVAHWDAFGAALV